MLQGRHAHGSQGLACYKVSNKDGEKMQQYETALERAQRLARESEGPAATQATWIKELKRLGYDTTEEERTLTSMKEAVWNAYAELSCQQTIAQ